LDATFNASKTGGNTNVYIKDGYMGVIEILGGESFGSAAVLKEKLNFIDAQYMPAYPVRMFMRGFTGGSNASVSSANKVGVEVVLLPELNSRGKVKTIISAALLDPKRWSQDSDIFWNENASDGKLGQYVHYSYRVQYLLKSYVDSLNGEEETE
jgi:hypothetical protein